jgi:hypothetical protein
MLAYRTSAFTRAFHRDTSRSPKDGASIWADNVSQRDRRPALAHRE